MKPGVPPATLGSSGIWNLAEEQTQEDRTQSWTKLYDQIGTVLA